MGVTSTAAAMIDGKIVACISEERFNRKKNYDGYPKHAVEFCMSFLGTADKILLASYNVDPAHIITHQESDRSVADWVREQKEYWYPRIYQEENKAYVDVFSDKIDLEQFPGTAFWNKVNIASPDRLSGFAKIRKKIISGHLSVSESNIEIIEHHLAHSMYAFFASPFRNENVLSFTADGFGDHSNASLRIFKANKEIQLVMESDQMNIGRLYRYITLLLGMKPGEHEYKVMGLAPYASKYHWQRPYDIFKDTLYVEGVNFQYNTRPKDHYFWFRDKLEGCRFDGIAGGLQRYVEDILVDWVKNAIASTGIKKIVFSGGVAMNIKAMMEIAKIPELENIWVAPSGSDESLAMGACYAYANQTMPMDEIRPLDHAYLGTRYSKKELESFVSSNGLTQKYDIVFNASPEYVAECLASGNVIAAFIGAMEFGARALGARSILADPRDTAIIKRINSMIKNRDFWMPFAPVMLKERTNDYLINPKNIYTPFMTIGFETTGLAQRDLAAALHPADMTARPQMIERQNNPMYYDIIKAFEQLTGVGGLLNTSFNLHGYPIVMSPADALFVFENSGLDMLLLEEILLKKKM